MLSRLPLVCVCAKNACLSMFAEYELRIQHLTIKNLRSDLPPLPDVVGEEEADDFIVPSSVSVVAVAPDTKSVDSIWFIMVIKINLVRVNECVDDYGHVVPPGMLQRSGHFLERVSSTAKSTIFKLSKKTTFFYKEAVLYPYANVTEGKKGFI